MKPVAIAVILALAACAPSGPPSAPSYSYVPPAPPPASPPEPAAEAPRDACGAYELQHLVGRPKSEIPVPLNPSRWRVACTTCPVTMDYREDRLNIFFDSDTGIVKQVKCG